MKQFKVLTNNKGEVLWAKETIPTYPDTIEKTYCGNYLFQLSAIDEGMAVREARRRLKREEILHG